MPWTPSDSKRFSKKASGNKGFSDQWSKVANKTLADTGDEGQAVKVANGVIKKRVGKTPPQKIVSKV